MEWLAYALGIMFWALCAMAVSCLIVYVFILVDKHKEIQKRKDKERIISEILEILENNS